MRKICICYFIFINYIIIIYKNIYNEKNLLYRNMNSKISGGQLVYIIIINNNNNNNKSRNYSKSYNSLQVIIL